MKLVDADALKEFFKEWMALWPYVDEVIDKINDAPTINEPKENKNETD